MIKTGGIRFRENRIIKIDPIQSDINRVIRRKLQNIALSKARAVTLVCAWALTLIYWSYAFRLEFSISALNSSLLSFTSTSILLYCAVWYSFRRSCKCPSCKSQWVYCIHDKAVRCRYFKSYKLFKKDWQVETAETLVTKKCINCQFSKTSRQRYTPLKLK